MALLNCSVTGMLIMPALRLDAVRGDLLGVDVEKTDLVLLFDVGDRFFTGDECCWLVALFGGRRTRFPFLIGPPPPIAGRL